MVSSCLPQNNNGEQVERARMDQGWTVLCSPSVCGSDARMTWQGGKEIA